MTTAVETPTKTFAINMVNHTGHERLVWSQHIPEQMKEAQAKFYELLDRGFSLYAVKENGERSSTKMTRFDPLVEEIVAVALKPIVGG